MSPNTLPDLPPLELNPKPQFDQKRIGQEQNVILIIDDALNNPEVLLEHARRASFGAPPPKSRYPGLVAHLPGAYIKLLQSEMRHPITSFYSPPYAAPLPVYGFFGLSTVPTSEFVPAQVAPHTDTVKLHSFASVHYLNQTAFGGTAFYRHKMTGFELISPIRSDKYAHIRRQEIAQHEGYPLSAIESLYEEIGYVEPKFNRLVLYRAGQLHRSRLDEHTPLTADPNIGRLTANLFFNTE